MLEDLLSPPIWRPENSVNIWNQEMDSCWNLLWNRTKRHLTMVDAIELESCKQI